MTVFLNGTLSDSISNQSWIAVKVVLAPESSSPQTLINQQYNLCSELGISCPVSAGSFTFNFTEILPSKFPANISIAAYVTGKIERNIIDLKQKKII